MESQFKESFHTTLDKDRLKFFPSCLKAEPEKLKAEIEPSSGGEL